MPRPARGRRTEVQPKRLIAAGLLLAALGKAEVFRHGRFEYSFQSSVDYDNPVQDAELTVEFVGPGGVTEEVLGFWDGGRTWKVRFSPDLAGPWSFQSRCSNPADRGLHRQGGSFRVSEYEGSNELYLHGAPRLSANRRYLVIGQDRPWFWLACTAWNGALKSTEEEWRRYIADRVEKKFTAVQFVTTQWRAAYEDEAGQVAFTGTDRIAINPKFYQRLDKKFDALNDAGLVAAPVLLWALTSKRQESPGETLPDDQAALLAKYMAARYGAHAVIWILGGDGDYRGEKAERWKKIGRAVFPPQRRRRLVGMHPRGMQDPWAAFADEEWLDLLLYQTGHGGNAAKWEWNARHGPADGWRLEPPRPVIDAEPNYEGHPNYHTKEIITETEVRRAAYYSLLSAPPAGVSYGAHGIWPWHRKLETPLNHERAGLAEPWTRCLSYPGGEQMKILREFFESIEWWKLRPDRSLLAEEPAEPDYRAYPMPARSADGRFAVVYLPNNPTGRLNLSGFAGGVTGTWIDPRNGQRIGAGQWAPSPSVEWRIPFGGDWLLLLRAGG